MTGSSKNVLLAWIAVGLLLGGAAMLVGVARAPLADGLENAGDVEAKIELRAAQSGDAALASFASAWSRDLRRPLNDEDPAAAKAAGPGDADGLPVRLVGTIVDPQRPRGIFVTVTGQMELRGVGDKAGGAEVISIGDRSATLAIAGKNAVLKVEKPEMSLPATGPGPAQPPSARSSGDGQSIVR